MNTPSPQQISVEKVSCAATITLMRPEALNALTDEMRDAIAEAMPGLSRDPIIYAMVIRAEGERAFCAGGDVRQLADLAKRDLAAARRSLANEYALNWRLECFSKPTASLVNGLVMGSGVGLTLYNTHRVAGPNYRFAMPEVAIGLFPDVGVSHVLARLPQEIGTYLALTGAQIGRADAFALGLATHCIDAEHFETIHAELSTAEPIDPLLDTRHQDPGSSELMKHGESIETWFAGNSLRAIRDRLADAANTETPIGRFAADALKQLETNSPLSMAITLEHLRRVASLDLRETLMQDYKLASRCLEGSDFFEGVRAMLIDKDRSPSWKPAKIDDVTDDMVAYYFSDADFEPLDLPTRAEMQAARA